MHLKRFANVSKRLASISFESGVRVRAALH